LALDEPKADDEVHEVAGITWLVSQRDAEYMLAGNGVRVDHFKEHWGAWFNVTRIGALSGCW
jgi:hypothetical protein